MYFKYHLILHLYSNAFVKLISVLLDEIKNIFTKINEAVSLDHHSSGGIYYEKCIAFKEDGTRH